MRANPAVIRLWKIVIFLLLINYQIVTIIMKDHFVFKYLRDFALIIFVFCVWKYYGVRKIKSITALIAALFSVLLINPIVKTHSLSVSLIFIRRYLYPLVVLYTASSIKNIEENQLLKCFHFILNLLFVLSVWGVIQALLLGDNFLMSLGYPTKYSYAYERITLKNSFYFGNLGIQRVVSTISNSNVCALIWGISIIGILMNAKKVLSKRKYRIRFIMICIAYIFTFSRANFLAMGIVGILFVWKFLPRKYRRFLIISILILLVILGVGYLIGDNVLYRIVDWIIRTFSGKESSASGRVPIWIRAFHMAKANPLGIGFGHVGSFAQISGNTNFVDAENSYLAIAIDTGWIGILTYCFFLVSLLKRYHKNYKNPYQRTGFAIVIYMMICFMFSNHIYDLEGMAYIMAFIGILYAGSTDKVSKIWEAA